MGKEYTQTIIDIKQEFRGLLFKLAREDYQEAFDLIQPLYSYLDNIFYREFEKEEFDYIKSKLTGLDLQVLKELNEGTKSLDEFKGLREDDLFFLNVRHLVAITEINKDIFLTITAKGEKFLKGTHSK